MARGLRTFVKFVGADDMATGHMAAEALKPMTCRVVQPLESAEAAKLMSLARYGLFISFAREQDEILKKYGVTYEDAVIDWEVSYNEGLLLEGRTDYVRPLITPPRGKIGGHCVVPAMEKVARESNIIKTAMDYEARQQGRFRYGAGTKIWHFVNILEGAEIGDHCVIGSYVEIGRGVKIGDHCKIEAGAYIPQGVTIGNRVFIGPGATFTNDKHPRAEQSWECAPTVVQDGASIGANATVVCGVTIGANAVVGAGAVVSRSVPPGEVYVGNPAKPIKKRK
jgi:acetyltransferase-like isoleucine patch superfamily enzyme